MFNNTLIDVVLRHLPQKKWNLFSSLCAGWSLPTIGSPIRFFYLNFSLEEFRTDTIPAAVYQKFIAFCYPEHLPNRLQQIECDRELYWKDTSIFIVFDATGEIAGCIQIVPRGTTARLPVEYADITGISGEKKRFDIQSVIAQGDITEIYRCRRSFALKKIEAFYVLLMLFKAVWAKTIQLGTAYSCISFNTEKKGLQHLYSNKLAFADPGITLTFGEDPTKWSLLVKDWDFHEKKFATLSKKQFFMQTWVRRGLKQKHHRLTKQSSKKIIEAKVYNPDSVLITHNIIVPKKSSLLKKTRRRIVLRPAVQATQQQFQKADHRIHRSPQ